MLKRFLSGLVFGVGFGIALILVINIYFYSFFYPNILKQHFTSDKVIGTPPKIINQQKFLGSSGIYDGNFSHDSDGVLAGGSGEIVGKALVDEKPAKGLKLRLALNGRIMSQWATTDENGIYSISVPFGDYKIDGFELDTNSAGTVLPGKIEHPSDAHRSEIFKVAKDSKGQGLNFNFVAPVEKKIPKNKYSINEDIVISWLPYPGANEYELQIYEKSEPNSFRGNKAIFEWTKRPRVSTTSFDLKNHDIKLKTGSYYSVEIEATDKLGGAISNSPHNYSGYDFEVTE